MTLDGREAQFREIAARRFAVVQALAPFGFRESSDAPGSDRWTIVADSSALDPGKSLPVTLLESARAAGADVDSRIILPIRIRKRQKGTLFSVHPVGDWIPRRDLRNKCSLQAKIHLEPYL